MEKMENRLVDMRELYQEWKDYDEDNPVCQVTWQLPTLSDFIMVHITVILL